MSDSRRIRRWAVLLCTPWLTACSAVVAGTPVIERTDPAAFREMTVNDLPQLLLKPTDFDDILDTTTMTVSETSDRAVALDPGQTVTGDAGCLGVAFSAMAGVYRGSGYLTALGQRVTQPDDRAEHVAFQFVALFPSAGGAERFRTESEASWRACAHKTVSVKQSDTVTDTWIIGESSTVGGIVSVVNLQEGGDGWACSRSLTARANVVVDVAACGVDVTADTSAAIVAEIAQKMRA